MGGNCKHVSPLAVGGRCDFQGEKSLYLVCGICAIYEIGGIVSVKGNE
jgi:hypothetical protein